MRRNKLAVIFNYKCPQCHEGDMFVKPFKYTDPLDMHSNCDKCGLDLEQEPGFYFGAMFISYIITITIMLVAAGVLIVGLKISENTSMLLILLIAALSFFKILRGARAIWLGTNVKYDENALNDFKKK